MNQFVKDFKCYRYVTVLLQIDFSIDNRISMCYTVGTVKERRKILMNNLTKAYHKFLNLTIEVSDLFKFYRTRQVTK